MRIKILNYILSVLFLVSGVAFAASLSVESDTQEFNDNEHKIFLEGNVKVKSVCVFCNAESV